MPFRRWGRPAPLSAWRGGDITPFTEVISRNLWLSRFHRNVVGFFCYAASWRLSCGRWRLRQREYYYDGVHFYCEYFITTYNTTIKEQVTLCRTSS